MCRLRRAAYRLLIFLSLVVFLASVAAWVRSYWVADGYSIMTFDHPHVPSEAEIREQWSGPEFSNFFAGIPKDVLSAGWMSGSAYLVRGDAFTAALWEYNGARAVSVVATSSFAGFGIYDNAPLDTAIFVPFWFIMLLAAVPPLVGWRRWRRSRIKPGHCLHCGYDLCATPDRCPECGTTTAASKFC